MLPWTRGPVLLRPRKTTNLRLLLGKMPVCQPRLARRSHGRGTDEPGVHHDGAIWNFSRDGRRQRNVVSHCSWELGRF